MPLSELDETLMHQGSTTFDNALSSDHRFFDRLVIGCHHDGEAALVMGFAAYKNMNTLEAFATLQRGDTQYNLRQARPLRPALATDLTLGPMRLEFVEPLQSLRLALDPEPDRPTAFELTWDGVFPAHEEGHHFDRRDGRVYQDYIRFDQLGRVNGWLEVEGDRIEVRDWFSFRDHSWGVRPGVGGYEPATGARSRAAGSLFIWLAFQADEIGGQFQTQEDGAGVRQSIDGHLCFADGFADAGSKNSPDLKVVDIQHEISFVPGTRVYDKAVLLVTTDDGREWEVQAEAVGRPWVYKGTGYDSGYDDEQGLGFHRGAVFETDRYDISHVEEAVLPDGRAIRPVHREQPVKLTVNGQPGYGHLPIINFGTITRYGLG